MCSLDVAFTSPSVRSRSQPFATIRARLVWPCLWQLPQQRSLLEVSYLGCVLALHGRRGTVLCDIPTCFITCRKSLCVAGEILLHCFQKMSCSLRGMRSTLETSLVILHGRRSTSDTSCCVFSANCIVRAAPSGDNG